MQERCSEFCSVSVKLLCDLFLLFSMFLECQVCCMTYFNCCISHSCFLLLNICNFLFNDIMRNFDCIRVTLHDRK